MDYKKYIQMIDEYLQEPNNINLEWVECLTVCRIGLERMRPKKPIFGYDEQDYICCPNCNYELETMDAYGDYFGHYNFCPNCGQALNWSDE